MSQPKPQEVTRIERKLAELIAKQAQYLLLELARLDRLRRNGYDCNKCDNGIPD